MSQPAITQDITFTIEPLPPLDALESIWRPFDSHGAHSFFLTWTWIGTWLRCLPPSAGVALLRANRGTETVGLSVMALKRAWLRGILPVRQAWLNSAGDAAFDCITIEHNGFASACSWKDEMYPALANWFVRGPLQSDEIVLPGVDAAPAADKTGLLVIDRREFGYRTPLEHLDPAHGIAPLLSRNARQQLYRSMRACEREGPLSVEVAKDAAEALEFFTQMKELHVRSWTRRGRRHAFNNPFFETFHRALIPEGIAERSVDLLHIAAGARTLGYLYNFRRNGAVFSYQSGFDDALREIRPGYVCHALAIAHYAAQGMCYYDFLAKPNRLKQSFGLERYELCWRRLRKPTLRFRAEALARKAASQFGPRRSGELEG